MKKALVLTLIFIFAVFLTSCKNDVIGDPNREAQPTETLEPAEVIDPNEIDWKGFINLDSKLKEDGTGTYSLSKQQIMSFFPSAEYTGQSGTSYRAGDFFVPVLVYIKLSGKTLFGLEGDAFFEGELPESHTEDMTKIEDSPVADIFYLYSGDGEEAEYGHSFVFDTHSLTIRDYKIALEEISKITGKPLEDITFKYSGKMIKTKDLNEIMAYYGIEDENEVIVYDPNGERFAIFTPDYYILNDSGKRCYISASCYGDKIQISFAIMED